MSQPTLLPASPVQGLNDGHYRKLRDSAISKEIIAGRGYRSIGSKTEIPRDSGISARNFPGLLIPLFGPKGEAEGWEYRPDIAEEWADGKARKYIGATGRPSVLDVHPARTTAIKDVAVPLWFTEGRKTADALTSAGACVIALAGVNNWKRDGQTLGQFEDLPMQDREVIICFDSDCGTNPQMMATMTRLANVCKSRRARTVRYIICPRLVNGQDLGAKAGADDYLAGGGDLAGLLAVATDRPPAPASSARFTDAFLADELVADELDGQYAWTKGLGWLGWDGRRWAEVPDAHVENVAKRWVQKQWHMCVKGGPLGVSTEELRGWKAALGKSKISAIVGLSRGEVLRDAAEFDAIHPDLINAANGVIDLRTGELREHDPALMMTRITRASYVRGAQSGDWTTALEAVPQDMRDWFQVRMGQAITGGQPPDDAILFNWGQGSNGKSTVMPAIRNAIGDYGVAISQRVLAPDYGNQHPTEMMTLRGARLAVLEELQDDRKLSVERMKAITTDVIKARKMHRDDVSFENTSSIVVNLNSVPLVIETDHGTWRRLIRMPWPYTFRTEGDCRELRDAGALAATDREQVPGLRERVREGLADDAILAWLVAGAVAFYRDGLGSAPERVVRATRQWRLAANPMGRFVADNLVRAPGSYIVATDLVSVFGSFLVTEGHEPWSDQTVYGRFPGACSNELHADPGERVQIRVTTPPSRPMDGATSLPDSSRVRGFRGVRWRTVDDDAADSEGDDRPVSCGVTGVTGSAVSVQDETSREGVTGDPVTSVTRDGQRVSSPCLCQLCGGHYHAGAGCFCCDPLTEHRPGRVPALVPATYHGMVWPGMTPEAVTR